MPAPPRYAEITKRTPNVSKGRNERIGCCFHHTGGSAAGAVSWLCNPQAKASAHVVIAKTGDRTVLAPDDAVTWHAGKSSFKGRSGCNRFLLGLEFELLDAHELLTTAQIESALEWLAQRWGLYSWTLADMTHHREISPGRKVDLNEANWRRLRAAIDARFSPRFSDSTVPDAQAVDVRPPQPVLINVDRCLRKPADT